MTLKIIATVCALLAAVPARGELDPMADAELSGVEGAAGIAVELGLYINSAEGTGAPLASLSNCAGVPNPCHFGLQFYNRNDASGEWLVLKDAWASLVVPTLNLDVGILSGTASNTGYFDTARFQNEAGTCLFGAGNCTTAYIGALPGLKMSVPAPAPSYNGTTFASSGYDSVSLQMNIGRMATEFGATGYDGDANGSFMGISIRDNNSNFAGIALRGNGYIFGF
ncbi:MAG: hypothetical protein ACOY3X_01610 [Pseudomonadota bacterium]